MTSLINSPCSHLLKSSIPIPHFGGENDGNLLRFVQTFRADFAAGILLPGIYIFLGLSEGFVADDALTTVDQKIFLKFEILKLVKMLLA